MSAQKIFLLSTVDAATEPTGIFYVIEKFPYPQFVMDEDGNIKSFSAYEAAAEEANDCQEGFVICL